MEITSEVLAWSTTDESRWNHFLQSTTGQRLLPKLAESAPGLLDGADVNKTLVRNGELRGFQEALRTLLSLSHSPPLPPRSVPDYPDLTDDSQWSDGQKLEPKKE
jgi:hypothetical protein